MGPGCRHHPQPGVLADPGGRRGIAPEAGGRRLDDRVDPGLAQQPRLGAAALLVVQLVTGQQRSDLEEVLVVIRAALRRGRDVAEDGAHLPGHGPASTAWAGGCPESTASRLATAAEPMRSTASTVCAPVCGVTTTRSARSSASSGLSDAAPSAASVS